jgi:hypothetical protein
MKKQRKLSHRLLLLVFAFFVLCAGSHRTQAQIADSKRTLRTVFAQFFKPMIGVWECTIRDWNEPGKPPVWEDRQERRFERILQNWFVQEHIFLRRQGAEPVEAGMHLYSFDGISGKVYQSGYWAQAPGRLFEVEGVFAKSGQRVEGTMTLRLPDGKDEKRRVEIEWQSGNAFVYRVFRRTPNGQEFLHSELTYKRKPA